MEDIMGKLSEVLNDPQSMQQLSQLASMFTNSNGDNESSPSQSESGSRQAQEQGQPQNQTPDISAMLSSLLSGAGDNSAHTAAPNQSAPPAPQGGQMPDIGKLMQIGNMISGSAANDKNIALLMALRPLLKEENQTKIDRLVKIFRLMAAYPLIRDSGLLGKDGIFGI